MCVYVGLSDSMDTMSGSTLSWATNTILHVGSVCYLLRRLKLGFHDISSFAIIEIMSLSQDIGVCPFPCLDEGLRQTEACLFIARRNHADVECGQGHRNLSTEG